MEISFTEIRPMKNEGTTLLVSLVDYWYSYKKRIHGYALEGGCQVSFKFDPVGDSLVLTKIDLWGI